MHISRIAKRKIFFASWKALGKKHIIDFERSSGVSDANRKYLTCQYNSIRQMFKVNNLSVSETIVLWFINVLKCC